MANHPPFSVQMGLDEQGRTISATFLFAPLQTPGDDAGSTKKRAAVQDSDNEEKKSKAPLTMPLNNSELSVDAVATGLRRQWAPASSDQVPAAAALFKFEMNPNAADKVVPADRKEMPNEIDGIDLERSKLVEDVLIGPEYRF